MGIADIAGKTEKGAVLDGLSAHSEFKRRIVDRREACADIIFAHSFIQSAIMKVANELCAFDFGKEADIILPSLKSVLPSLSAFQPAALTNEANYRLLLRELCLSMDCVQCNTCRIHGKVLTLGLATAYKALFEQTPKFTRVEIGALLCSLWKLTNGCSIIDKMSNVVKV